MARRLLSILRRTGLCFFPANLATFSMTKNRGWRARTAFTKLLNSRPRLSLSPSPFPVLEKDWQGGPPTSAKGRYSRRNEQEGSSLINSSMLPGTTFRPFATRVSTAWRFHSWQTLMVSPAFSKPMSSPPAPENNDITFLFIQIPPLAVYSDFLPRCRKHLDFPKVCGCE